MSNYGNGGNMILEAVTGLLGVIIPPAMKLIRNKWGKKQDDPEEMIGALAEDKPDILPQYLDALGRLYEAKKNYFNRDIVDTDIWKWVKSIRAAIRPVSVAISLLALVFYSSHLDPATRAAMGGWIGSWMGDRIDV